MLGRDSIKQFRGSSGLLQFAYRAGGSELFFVRRRRVIVARTPTQLELRKAHTSTAARASTAERVILEQTQPFNQAGEQFAILGRQHIEHKTDAKTRTGGNALESARVRLRRNAVDCVLALHLSDLIIEVLAHLRRNALEIERR